MIKVRVLFLFVGLVLVSACSHTSASKGITISSATNGPMKTNIASFPIYLTSKLEPRAELEKKYSSDLYLIHIGHLLNSKATKDENEKILLSLKNYGIDLFNLTLEDFAIAETQGLHFEDYDQTFLNSTVYDLSKDALVVGKNIFPFKIHQGITFIGLSDTKLDINIPNEKFIITDYVLSILKVKKMAIKSAPSENINSFILIHNLDFGINEVMERLPPSFINSLAD